jgi:short subunit dehydrogenase-like uncharacterized protein
MIAESALYLLENPDVGYGGISTPAAALGSGFIDRLQQNAGLTFQLETL